MLYHYVIALLVTCVVHLALAIIVFSKGRKRLSNITFALYSTAGSWWSGFEAFSISVHDQNLALFLWRLNHIGVIFIPIFLNHFVVSLLEPEKRNQRKKVVQISYLIGLCFVLLNITGILIREVSPKFSFRYFINASPIYPVFFVIWGAWACYGLANLFRILANSTGQKREQLSYFSWFMLAAYLGGAPNFLPTFNIEIPVLMPFGTYAVPLYGVVTAYAIDRYHLLDIRVLTSYLVIFIIVFGLIFFLPLFLLFPAQEQLRAGLWGAAVSVVFLVYRYLQKKAESGILREEKSYLKALEDASKEMQLIKDLDRLMETIVTNIVNNIQISNAALYLKNQEGYHLGYAFGDGKESLPKEIAQEDLLINELRIQREPMLREEAQEKPDVSQRFSLLMASVIIPCLIKENLLGFLALGEKKSGKAYNPDDLNAFQGLAVPLALAIENTRYLKQLEETHAKLVEAEKFRALRQMLNALSHEINNQLTRMIGPMQMITIQNKDKLDEELTKKLKGIWQEGMTAAEILHDVKRYRDKSESKELVEVEIEAMIEGAWKKFSGLLDQMGVVVHKELASPLGKFRGRESFTELFYNLMKNSYFNLREPERKELWIEAHRNGTCVEVVIKDTGGDFSRVVCDDTTGGELFAERGKLGGVNLYLAQTIARDAGIELKLESNQGIGVIFRVRIPLAETTPSGGG